MTGASQGDTPYRQPGSQSRFRTVFITSRVNWMPQRGGERFETMAELLNALSRDERVTLVYPVGQSAQLLILEAVIERTG